AEAPNLKNAVTNLPECMPTTVEELTLSASAFMTAGDGLPQCFAALDGKHIGTERWWMVGVGMEEVAVELAGCRWVSVAAASDSAGRGTNVATAQAAAASVPKSQAGLAVPTLATPASDSAGPATSETAERAAAALARLAVPGAERLA
ncbi:hypothetical protein HaLaN_24286, partial [Haematococcus lacustris]